MKTNEYYIVWVFNSNSKCCLWNYCKKEDKRMSKQRRKGLVKAK